MTPDAEALAIARHALTEAGEDAILIEMTAAARARRGIQ